MAAAVSGRNAGTSVDVRMLSDDAFAALLEPTARAPAPAPSAAVDAGASAASSDMTLWNNAFALDVAASADAKIDRLEAEVADALATTPAFPDADGSTSGAFEDVTEGGMEVRLRTIGNARPYRGSDN